MQDIQLIQLNDQLTSQATEMDDITQKFTDLTILNESYKSQIESMTSNQLKELEQLRENYTKLEESYRKIDSQLYVEKEKVKRIESERNEMRQQLASNADLLVSEFTRGSDLRNSMRSISSDGTNVDSSNTDSQTQCKEKKKN
uniref:Uncharacterized protein n=1 Tax=Panagrolaimus davidi TaxID=227884 RepID=A0A914P8V8_9BILA